MENIREKLIETINSISSKIFEDDELKKIILKTFPEAYVNDKNIKQAYYQNRKIQMYLKNSNGLYFEISSGKGDIFGDSYSNEGIDIKLVNGFTDQSIDIYIESKIQFSDLNSDDLNILFVSEKINTENIIKNPLILHTSNFEIMNDNTSCYEEIIAGMWRKAEYNYSDECNYDLISPYGGLDATIHTPSEHFIALLNELKSFPILHDLGEKFLANNEESKIYLKKTIAQAEKEMFYVDHQKIYKKIWDMEIYSDFSIDELEKTKNLLQIAEKNLDDKRIKLHDIENKIEEVQSKKYTLIEQFKKIPMKERNFLEEAAGSIKLDELNLADEYQECLCNYNEMEKAHKYENLKNNLTESLPLPRYEYDAYPTDFIDYGFDESMEYYESRYNRNQKLITRYEEILNNINDLIQTSEKANELDSFENLNIKKITEALTDQFTKDDLHENLIKMNAYKCKSIA